MAHLDEASLSASQPGEDLGTFVVESGIPSRSQRVTVRRKMDGDLILRTVISRGSQDARVESIPGIVVRRSGEELRATMLLPRESTAATLAAMIRYFGKTCDGFEYEVTQGLDEN